MSSVNSQMTIWLCDKILAQKKICKMDSNSKQLGVKSPDLDRVEQPAFRQSTKGVTAATAQPKSSPSSILIPPQSPLQGLNEITTCTTTQQYQQKATNERLGLLRQNKSSQTFQGKRYTVSNLK